MCVKKHKWVVFHAVSFKVGVDHLAYISSPTMINHYVVGKKLGVHTDMIKGALLAGGFSQGHLNFVVEGFSLTSVLTKATFDPQISVAIFQVKV